ncbi:OppA family ABC transporter substrate-binding lipoprotein [Mycoplasmopsis opalescens]|uniref:OppA family ABC transporter substrate-binding lipoprotein n=1 Tax=Mycoplasmopsis opalescens TaxID=114886 RepID=UPI0004A6CD83|nr:hypothetical protein [Mycoplasmopsis opalescens]
MKKRILILTPLIALPFSSISCFNVRAKADASHYIIQYNDVNDLEDGGIINRVKRVEKHYESALFAPLIRWKYHGKARYDYVNNEYYRVTLKSLEFALAKEVILDVNGTTISFTKDEIDQKLRKKANQNGIVNAYSDDKNNINSENFFSSLAKAKKITFVLKDNLYFVDNNGNKTSYRVDAKSFWNSLNYEDNFEKVKKLHKELSINIPKEVDFKENKITFLTNESLENFILNELPNNLVYSAFGHKNIKNKNINNLLFAGPFILKENKPNIQKFIKNEEYKASNNGINKISIKFNPLPIDSQTFRLQLFNGFRQNLISQAPYNEFNSKQQKEISQLFKLYGLTFSIPNSTNTNTIKTWWNNELDLSKNIYFNDVLAKFYFGYDIDKIKQNPSLAKENYFNYNSIIFRNVFSNIFNTKTLANILNKRNYWNSLIGQNLLFDSINAATTNAKKTYEYRYLINQKWIWETKNNKFNLIVKHTEYGPNNDIDNFFKNENIIDVSKQIKSPDFEIYKEILKNNIDDFYIQNPKYKNQKMSFSIPVYAEKNSFLDSFYEKLINLFNSIDPRLNVSYHYAKQNDLNAILRYKTIETNINTFSQYLKQIINDSSISSILQSFWQNENIINSTKIKNILQPLKILLTSQDANKDKQIIKFAQSLTTEEQLSLIKALDLVIGVFPTENNTAYVNDFDQEIVQFYYEKPLNDQGITNFQDIIVND